MKRFISLLLTAVICFSLSVPALAAEEKATKTPHECLYSLYSGFQADRISDRIADSAEYWPNVTVDGYETVCAGVRISENPELANPKVFRKTVVKMVDRTHTVIENPNENTVFMDYNRFAGELAFHVFAILMLNALGGTDFPNHAEIYEMFDRADMNIDEHRLPQMLMTIIGVMIMGIFP
ncbi:MAG: hypothetical protein IJN81_02805 [Clostridia bacterium]|nr:hypothetical protein [Clostridia bacterium]